ncbi:hypothetical protein Tco_1101072, partial [Tanacetum coccineum]
MMSQTRSTRGQENSAQPYIVFTKEDLLTEILIRLPILCIHLFTTVSKQWLQILTYTDFSYRYQKIPNIDPPVGIFANRHTRLCKYEFVSLDPRLESRKSVMNNSFTLGSNEEAHHVNILQSCNWSLCMERLSIHNFAHYCNSIYWNDAFHWLQTEDRQLTLYKFNIDGHDHPIKTTLEIPNGLHQGRNLIQSFDDIEGSYVPMIEQIDILGILHLQSRLFESRGCFASVCRHENDTKEVYYLQMGKGCPVWKD